MASIKNLISGCAKAASSRVLAFGVMAVCLGFTLNVTAQSLRLSTVADPLYDTDPDDIRLTALGAASSDEEGRYYTAFSGNLGTLDLGQFGSIDLDKAFSVTIRADGQDYPVTMLYGTVADALTKAGITLEGEDYTEPALNETVTIGSQIVVHRVDYQDVVETEVIPYDTEYVYTSLYFRNTSRTTLLRSGVDGEKTITTRERWVDGELENSVVMDETTTVEPVSHLIKTYGAGAPVSSLTGPDGTTNAPSSYQKVLTGKATGYYSRGGKGASGLGLGYGTVAVDPDVIPYGSLLYITSTDGKFVYGYAIATDTGLALQRGQILVDLFYETYAESVLNGAIQVNVYVVS